MQIETFSGNVQMVLPTGVAARFNLLTYSGQITSDLGPKPRKTERFSPYVEMRFTTAESEFGVGVKTFSGNITVGIDAAKTAPAPAPRPQEPDRKKGDRGRKGASAGACLDHEDCEHEDEMEDEDDEDAGGVRRRR
jgi:hypothetical protein